MTPTERVHSASASATTTRLPTRASSITLGLGTMAAPMPTSTARLIVSMLSNSATRLTLTPCARKILSVARRVGMSRSNSTKS